MEDPAKVFPGDEELMRVSVDAAKSAWFSADVEKSARAFPGVGRLEEVPFVKSGVARSTQTCG